MLPTASLDPVTFIQNMPGYTKNDRDRIAKLVAKLPGTAEEKVAAALPILGGLAEEPKEATKPVEVPAEGIKPERKLKLVPSPQEQEAAEVEVPAEGIRPKNWFVEQLSILWHSWTDPVMQAHVQERDRLLAPRLAKVKGVAQWLHLVKQAEKERNPGTAVALLKEAIKIERSVGSPIRQGRTKAPTGKART